MITARELELIDKGKRLGKRLGPKWEMMYLADSFIIQRMNPKTIEWEDFRTCPWDVFENDPAGLQALMDDISREHEREVEDDMVLAGSRGRGNRQGA